MNIIIPLGTFWAIIEFLKDRRSDIMLNIENFGKLRVVLEWAEREGFLE